MEKEGGSYCSDEMEMEDRLYWKPPKMKSKMMLGNVNYYVTVKFNKLQKWMWKKCFNVDIVDVEE